MRLPRVVLGVGWVDIPVFHFLRQRFRRPRFTVRSLMIVVVVVSLISTVVAYEERLKRRVLYHESMYFEHINVVSPQTRAPRIMVKMRDGTWSLPHQKTPQAEWHEQMKWEYQGAIIRTNQLLLAVLVGSAILYLIGRRALKWLHPVRGGGQ